MTDKPVSVWIGFEPREADAFMVACHSIRRFNRQIPIFGVVLDHLKARGWYTRPTERRKSAADRDILWDVISDAPMSTEFSISRFLVPQLVQAAHRRVGHDAGWGLFMDCDTMVRENLTNLFRIADDNYALMCVQHNHNPDNVIKMDGQAQTLYTRKNWSSVMLFNCDHEKNKKLTVETINTLPGRDLHRFCWLEDKDIGQLDQAWNFLVGYTDSSVNASIVHFTEGVPSMAGHESDQYANEWFSLLTEAAIKP